ncbi:SCO family protein [Cognatishimia sp. SS12]|uniref:SCO family protein n=1 Tax=Cognatishimia sp. SS12 TaxID=2979465 RepID=UPI00232BFB54|nr:SCO family protein [Cognatishimia sp. SS12]MDC0737763.1 SCO family protein [Cognatishimia sp. SS12]
MIKLIAGTSTVAMIALMGGIWYLTNPSDADQFADCRASAVAGGSGAIGGPFELVREDGVTVTDAEVITAPSLLYFGYTFCPDVCPLDGARNAEAVDVLESQGIQTTPVMITIDPARDTPEVMAEYTDYLHPRMIGLTGSEQQVKAASQAYKTYYKKQPADDDFYLMDHSTFTYLVLPEHGFVEFFRRDLSAEQVAETVSCFVKNA